MASKYAHLKGRIPEQEKAPSPRDIILTKEMSDHAELSLTDLAAKYNQLEAQLEEKAKETSVIKNRQDAIDILMRKAIDGQDIEKIGLDSYTWSLGYEPYPVADNVEAAVQYFKDNGLEDKLKLTASEVASRLKGHVKEEAQNNELVIVEIPGLDGQPPKQEVRSKIPGVKVFLKQTLSRVKSTATKRS